VRLLLDTHMFIWWDRQLNRVPPALRTAIEDGSNDICVSAATVWEIAIKRARGKLDFPAPITETVKRLNFELLPISGAHAEHAGRLPLYHGDPFDRMLIAQAMLEGMVLGTQDVMARPYGIPTLGLDS
jgi:PIN domain nuclease of toxin-antitoxin system